MATLSFVRFAPGFQSFGARVWTLPVGDAFNYSAISARPVNAGDSAFVNSVRAVTNASSSETAVSVTLFRTDGSGGSGGLVRLTAIGAHA